MKKLNYIAWMILILFGALLAYFGTRALHFNYPILFIVIAIVGSILVILSFSILKRIY